MMKMDRNNRMNFLARLSLMCGLFGMLIGLAVAHLNGDIFSTALLRASSLAVVFAWTSRFLAIRSMRAWLENRIDDLSAKKAIKQQEDAKKRAPAQPGATPARAAAKTR